MKTIARLGGRGTAVCSRAEAPEPPPFTPPCDNRDRHLDETASSPEGRYSPDPLRDTDRYRLVTPYVLSARALGANGSPVRI